MRWWSHIAIAAAPTALISPELVPLAVAGATAPDWLEYVARAFGQPVKHRGVTHYLAVWLFLSVIALLFKVPYLAVFFLAGLSHILADALTPSGVPVGWWSRSHIHFFGGRIRTGSPMEYVVSGAVLLICGFLSLQGVGSGVSPWLMPWQTLYQNGVIDLYEWRVKRWEFL